MADDMGSTVPRRQLGRILDELRIEALGPVSDRTPTRHSTEFMTLPHVTV